MILVARGLLTFLASTFQSSTIMMVEVISMGAHVMGVIVPSTCSDQEYSQGGRGVIVVAAHFTQGSIDHKYYIDFNNDYFLDSSFSGITIVHDYYSHVVKAISAFGFHRDFELVKDHRVQWDPGGSRRRRLEVKPNLKEGGMLGAHLAYMGSPRPAHGPGPLENHQTTSTREEPTKEAIQWIRNGGGGTYLRVPLVPHSL